MKIYQLKACFLGAVLVACANYAFSDDGVITEDDLFAEIDFVSGVTHLKQDLKQVPAAVTIIDRRTIESSTAVDLVDLFRLVPGFQVYFHHANMPGVNYHAPGGEYSRRLEVKIDGRSVYEPLLSSVEWNTLGVDIEDIEYIEVVRGSNASADGSNAFLASINIVTRSPLVDMGTQVSVQYGTQGNQQGKISHATQFGQLASRAVIKVSKNDGFVGANDSADTLLMRYQGLWTPTVTDTVNFQIGMGDTDTIINPTEVHGRHWKSNYQHLEWQRIANNWSDIEFGLYHNAMDFVDDHQSWSVADVLNEAGFPLTESRELLENEPNQNLKIVESTYAHNADRWNADLRANIYRRDDLRINLGMASRYDSFGTELFLSGSGKVSEVSNRLYANFELTAIDNLTLNYGHVLEKRRDKEATNAFRVAANYQLSKQHMFRVASNRSYRQPALIEAHQNSIHIYNDIVMHVLVQADSDISKEKLISHEIGYLGSFFEKSLNLDVRLFDENLSNLIGERRGLYQDVSPYYGETQLTRNIIDNIEDIRIKGLEWQLQYRPSNKLLLNINFSHVDVEGVGRYGVDVETPWPYQEFEPRSLDRAVPENMFNALVGYKTNSGIQLSGSYHYKSGYESKVRRGFNVESYSRIDLKASKRWSLASNWIELSFTAQNVGSDYLEHKTFYNFENKFESKYVLGLKMGSR